MRTAHWLRRAGVGLALLSGVAAAALSLLPLLLVLLMLLFDHMTRGVFVLLQLLFGWLGAFLPGGEQVPPPLSTLLFHPVRTAVASFARATPCLAGLALILIERDGTRWWWIVLLWGCSAATGGEGVATTLMPGLLVAIACALAGRSVG